MQELNDFTHPTSFTTYFVHHGAQYSVTVTTPDLRETHGACWGEWGPNYTLYPEPGQSFRVTYRSARRGLISDVYVRPSAVEIYPPALLEERIDSPFCLQFEDCERGLRFLAYLDHSGSVRRAEVEALDPEADIDALIFEDFAETQLSA